MAQLDLQAVFVHGSATERRHSNAGSTEVPVNVCDDLLRLQCLDTCRRGLLHVGICHDTPFERSDQAADVSTLIDPQVLGFQDAVQDSCIRYKGISMTLKPGVFRRACRIAQRSEQVDIPINFHLASNHAICPHNQRAFDTDIAAKIALQKKAAAEVHGTIETAIGTESMHDAHLQWIQGQRLRIVAHAYAPT